METIQQLFEPLVSDDELLRIDVELRELEERESIAEAATREARELVYAAREAADAEEVKRELGEKSDVKAARARCSEAETALANAEKKYLAIGRGRSAREEKRNQRLNQVRQSILEDAWDAARQRFQAGINVFAELAQIVSECNSICFALENHGLPNPHPNFFAQFSTELSDSYIYGPGLPPGVGALVETRLSLLFSSARALGYTTPPLSGQPGANVLDDVLRSAAVTQGKVAADRRTWKAKVGAMLDFAEELVNKD